MVSRKKLKPLRSESSTFIDCPPSRLIQTGSFGIPSVVSLKFIEERPQILRLTTPNHHPTNEDLFVGTPEDVRGPVRSE